MIILGAGGHAAELLDVLQESTPKDQKILFFDNINYHDRKFLDQHNMINTDFQLRDELSVHNLFYLGVGPCSHRFKLHSLAASLGGKHMTVTAGSALISSNLSSIEGCDIFPFSYVGPNVSMGYGSLLHTRASVHHDVVVGRFTVIAPSSTVLGRASIGDFCFIGAGSTILPNVRIGSNSIVAAGAVVTHDVPSNVLLAGVPGKVKKTLIV